MTGAELKHIREAKGWSQADMALRLGYTGKRQSLKTQIFRFEDGLRPIPEQIAGKAEALTKE